MEIAFYRFLLISLWLLLIGVQFSIQIGVCVCSKGMTGLMDKWKENVSGRNSEIWMCVRMTEMCTIKASHVRLGFGFFDLVCPMCNTFNLMLVSSYLKTLHKDIFLPQNPQLASPSTVSNNRRRIQKHYFYILAVDI